jgi:hypothetical protein
MNSINIIVPYQHEGMWVFDDPRVGLDKEPFVSGADTMINVLVADIPHAERGFRLLFAAAPFPNYAAKLEWRREEHGGNWYFSPDLKMEGWLCPALFKYFEGAPKDIHLKQSRKPNPVDRTGEPPPCISARCGATIRSRYSRSPLLASGGR